MAVQPKPQQQVAILDPPRLPYNPELETRYGVDQDKWRALTEAVFPNARTASAVHLALSYCKSRGLDPLKRVVHIVPIWQKPANKGERGRYVETVWPGISELRTTASRTRLFAGCTDALWGPDQEQSWPIEFEDETGAKRERMLTVIFPEWCQITVRRFVNGIICDFVGPKTYWLECYATIGRSDMPNDMWQSRPRGQLEKCAEAAALRRAFPEEIGNEFIDDEIGHAAREYHPAVDDKITEARKTIEAPDLKTIEHEQPEKPQEPPSNIPPTNIANGAATGGTAAKTETPKEPKTESEPSWFTARKLQIAEAKTQAEISDIKREKIDPYRTRMTAQQVKALDALVAQREAEFREEIKRNQGAGPEVIDMQVVDDDRWEIEPPEDMR